MREENRKMVCREGGGIFGEGKRVLRERLLHKRPQTGRHSKRRQSDNENRRPPEATISPPQAPPTPFIPEVTKGENMSKRHSYPLPNYP